MTYLEKAESLYKMIGEGKILDAFEKYYAEDVVLQEPTKKIEGKKAARKHEEEFVSNVKDFHGMEITAKASDEQAGKVFIEVWMDVTFQDDNRVKMEQVTVQTWKGDQIVHERFYYNP